MAHRLKSRQHQIPNGFKWLQPQTNWRPRTFESFDSIVRSLIRHRQGRPDLIAKHGWATDYDTVANEVEQFNVNLCLKHGWVNYLEGMEAGGGSLPKTRPPSPANVENVAVAAGASVKIWSGIKTLNEWIQAGGHPVEPRKSEVRASVCVACPKNVAGNFSDWFTRPAAGAIKKQIEQLAEHKLSTPHDEKLNVCEICLCPMKLKVHAPMEFIKAHMHESVLADLQQVPGCWVVEELRA